MNKEYQIKRLRNDGWQVVSLGKNISVAKIVKDEVVCHVGSVNKVYNTVFGHVNLKTENNGRIN